MPRARNEETERAIRAAAWQLFFDNGIEKTTYTALARRSGVSRPLVQRYFPKKEMLVDECVATIRAASVCVCDERYGTDRDPLELLYLRGQVNIATYFACEGLRKIMVDVFSSRELTQRTIADGFRWTVSETLPGHDEVLAAGEPDELIMAMGGLYELVYFHLSRSTTPDIAACVRPSIEVFARLFDLETSAERLDACAIPADERDELARKAVSAIDWR